MKKILYIGYYSIHDYKWIELLAQNHDLEIHFAVENDFEENNNPIKSKFHELQIHIVPSFPSFSLKKLKTTRKTARFLNNYISKHSVQLIHILFATPHAFWCNYVNIPYIITTRGSDILKVIPELNQGKGLSGLYSKCHYKLLSKAFRNSVHITSTSEKQREKVKELFQCDRTSVIRTGIAVGKMKTKDYRSYLPKQLKGTQYILSSRFFNEIYNQELILEAIKLLPSNIKESYAFVFIKGSNFDVGYSKYIFQCLEQLEIKEGIKFFIFDYLEQDEFAAVTKYASLSVMVPKSDGTPNSALEAMVLKTPLIIPPLDYDADLFNKTCIKLNSWEPMELSKAMEDALNNYSVDMLNIASQKVVNGADLMSQVLKIRELYQSIN